MTNKIQVDVIIVALTTTQSFFDMTMNCIRSLRESEPEIDFRIILMEDNKKYHEGKWKYPDDVFVGVSQEKFCYNKSMANGLMFCKSDWVILANNDLIFKKHFMQEIIKAYDHFDGAIESFGVWNEKTHGSRFPDRKPINMGYRVYYEVSGWCIVAKRKVFEKINFSNPTNQKIDFWFSDNRYADLLQYHGIRHALVRDAKVDHLESTTINTFPEKEKWKLMQGQERKYMESKV
jgi:hypothetical protein